MHGVGEGWGVGRGSGGGWGGGGGGGELRKTHQKDKVRKKTGDDIKQLVEAATHLIVTQPRASFCIVMYE